MFNVGPAEVLIILVVALLILGPKKLPEAARQIGKAMTEFRRVTSDLQNEVRTVLDDHLTDPPPAVDPTASLPPVAPIDIHVVDQETGDPAPPPAPPA